MRRFVQIKGVKSKRATGPDRIAAEPQRRTTADLIAETTVLIQAIDRRLSA